MIIDIVLIVVLILMMLYGYKKGCIGIIAKLISVIVALVLAYVLADNIGNMIQKTTVGEKLQTNIESIIEEKLRNEDNKKIQDLIQNDLNAKDKLSVSSKIIDYIFYGLGFLTVFLVLRIVLYILEKILEGIFELPVLKTFNKLGGIIVSLFLLLLELSILLAIIQSLSALAFMTNIINVIDTSIITKAIYEHNIITNLIINKLF